MVGESLPAKQGCKAGASFEHFKQELAHDGDTSAARACARAPDAGQHGDTGGTASQQCTVGV